MFWKVLVRYLSGYLSFLYSCRMISRIFLCFVWDRVRIRGYFHIVFSSVLLQKRRNVSNSPFRELTVIIFVGLVLICLILATIVDRLDSFVNMPSSPPFFRGMELINILYFIPVFLICLIFATNLGCLNSFVEEG